MLQDWAERIGAAAAAKATLRLAGAGSKDFYGQALAGEVFDTRPYAGIIDYEPTELVVTARCGTRLADIEAALAERGQMLAFEPPHFGPAATVGGCVAAGLSGPRRAAVGSVRDFVLGVKLIDGAGRTLTFGGQVMKNVAGYDIPRLVTGSLGTLALIAEVSLKVLPRPVAEATLRLDMPQDKALDAMNRWAGQPLPISASCWHDDVLSLRLSGARAAVVAARAKIGGEALDDAAAAAFWAELREQRHAFLAAPDGGAALWRLSLPSVTPVLALPGATLIEWGGAQRWLRCDAGNDAPRRAAQGAGGHATLFRADAGAKQSIGVFQPLDPVSLRLHRELRRAFDPHGVFDSGRLYPDL